MVPLLVALGIDNLGSGLFLPLTLVYATRVVGLPLAVAGVTVTVGTVVGLLVPPVAGRLVDRVGPRPVVIASQLVQAAGALGYAVADGVATVAVAACLLAAGQQLFYSSLFSLLADMVGDRPKDHPFAVFMMVRLQHGLASARHSRALTRRLPSCARSPLLVPRRSLRARQSRRRRPAQGDGRLPRTTTLAIGAVLVVVWCALCLAALALPAGWLIAWLLMATLVLAASELFFGARVNALAVDRAPAETRGRHLAAFQYAFTAAGVLAPAVVALFAVGRWAPWVVVAACAGVGAWAFARKV